MEEFIVLLFKIGFLKFLRAGGDGWKVSRADGKICVFWSGLMKATLLPLSSALWLSWFSLVSGLGPFLFIL